MGLVYHAHPFVFSVGLVSSCAEKPGFERTFTSLTSIDIFARVALL